MTDTLVPVEAGTISWPAPSGVLGTAEGIQAALTALRLEGYVRREGEVLHFAGTRRPIVIAALCGALAGVVGYLVADGLGASPMLAVTAVTISALLAPPLLVPAHRVAGRVEAGRVTVNVRSRGLFARSKALEKRLRFYLDRSS